MPRISELPAFSGNLTGTELMTVVSGGVTYKATPANLLAYFKSKIGHLDYDVQSGDLSLADSKVTNNALKNYGTITYLQVGNNKYKPSEFTYNQTAGSITLLNGDTFAVGYGIYFEYDKS